MPILFRAKEWLTVAQLARAWSAEIPGAKQDPQQFEQDLVQLLLEDIINKRLDDAGPLADGRRLGLRVITPEGRAGFLEGHQARDLILSGGALAFYLNRIVVMKEAALDFARRHELPPPSWWTDTFAASTEPPNHLASDPIPKAASKSPAEAGLKRPRGAKPKKLEQVKEAMRNDVRQRRRTVAELSNMLEKDLAAEYGVSRDTARKARKAVSELVENSILDKLRQTINSHTQKVLHSLRVLGASLRFGELIGARSAPKDSRLALFEGDTR